jgi:hypothetical protein
MSMIALPQAYRTRIAALTHAIGEGTVLLAGADTITPIAISLLTSLLAAGFRRRKTGADPRLLKRTV